MIDQKLSTKIVGIFFPLCGVDNSECLQTKGCSDPKCSIHKIYENEFYGNDYDRFVNYFFT